jgi:hypothetical protein
MYTSTSTFCARPLKRQSPHGRQHITPPPGLLQQFSVGSDDAFDDVEKCKPHVKKQIMLKYADMVVRDMPLLSSLQRYVHYVNPCLLQRMHDIF